MRRLCAAVLLGALRIAFAQTEPAPARDGFVVGALRLVQPAEPEPLTERERFHQYLLNTIGPVPVFLEGAGAGLSQAVEIPSEWGQGASGYFHRFGNNLAYNGVRNTLTYATSILFREDTRYFASGKEGTWPRVAHALASAVMARDTEGRDRISISAIAGVAGAAAISRAWSPPNLQGGKNVARAMGITFAGQAGFNVFREFVPDLIRRLQRRERWSPYRAGVQP
jgi:hypothetical protein